jgi:AraC-like DNA-binding protein
MSMHAIEDHAQDIEANTSDALAAITACVRFAAAVVPRHSACAECGGLTWTWIARLLHDRAPRHTFDEWTSWLIDHVSRRHPAPCAERAAALIRAAPARSWTLGHLARQCGESPSRLRRSFIDRFGLSPVAYVQAARVVAAIGLSASGSKVEPLAHEVGYCSKKDLYAALDRWVGRTPLELSRMTDDEREFLAKRVEALLDRRVDADLSCAQVPAISVSSGRALAISAIAGADAAVARPGSSTSPA